MTSDDECNILIAGFLRDVLKKDNKSQMLQFSSTLIIP